MLIRLFVSYSLLNFTTYITKYVLLLHQLSFWQFHLFGSRLFHQYLMHSFPIQIALRLAEAPALFKASDALVPVADAVLDLSIS